MNAVERKLRNQLLANSLKSNEAYFHPEKRIIEFLETSAEGEDVIELEEAYADLGMELLDLAEQDIFDNQTMIYESPIHNR